MNFRDQIKNIYRGNLTWLADRTIYYVRHGSHSYGTNIEGSDEDFRGIVIPPKEYFYGCIQKFEQAEIKDPDVSIYDIRKTVNLAANGNPSFIELLFTEDENVLGMSSPMEILLSNRDLCLSKKIRHTYSGYAISQWKRMELHQKWLRNPPKEPPTRASLGLPERTLIPKDQLEAVESMIRKKIGEWNLGDIQGLDPATRICIKNYMIERLAEIHLTSDDLWKPAARALGVGENFIHLMDLERRYTSKKREWDNYQEWKRNRNPKRAALEAEFGFDLKNCMHMVRLFRTCEEILTTGKVHVKRPDAEELISIRKGAWTYEQVSEFAKTMDAKMSELEKKSKLPYSPDYAKMDEICCQMVEKALTEGIK